LSPVVPAPGSAAGAVGAVGVVGVVVEPVLQAANTVVAVKTAKTITKNFFIFDSSSSLVF